MLCHYPSATPQLDVFGFPDSFLELLSKPNKFFPWETGPYSYSRLPSNSTSISRSSTCDHIRGCRDSLRD